jgi:hypothetical protein
MMMNEVHPIRTGAFAEAGSRNPKAVTGALILICFLAAVFIGIPAYSFLWRFYAWHLKQPETVQGGIELLVVFLILAAAVVLIRLPRLRSIILAFIAMLYLQLHSILLPAALGWLFLESLVQTGSAIRRLIRAGDSQNCDIPSYLGRFVVGVAGWTSGAILLSAFGLGSLSYLRFYTVVLTLVSVAASPCTPLILMLVRRFEQMGSKDRVLVVFVTVLILTQFGKANYGYDFDSMWYGLRPERVLVGPHSLFDDLKLMNFVYYYPKQFEVLTLPLAKLSDGAFIIPFNIVLFILGLLAVFGIGRELDIRRTGALMVTALVGTIPAFSNMASTAKTDTLLALYAFVSTLFLWRWCKRRDAMDFSLGSAAILGMAGTKISAYAYAPLLLLGFLGVGFWMHRRNRLNGWFRAAAYSRIDAGVTGGPKGPVALVGIAACAYAGLLIRTWIMTGIPTMPAFADKWMLLGFSPKYPWSVSGFVFAGVPIQSTREFIVYWYRLLFNPQSYSHFVMAWPGNAAFFLCCVIVILAIVRVIRSGPAMAFLFSCIPIMAGGILAACVVITPEHGFTDGNYYAVPIILTILSAAGVLAATCGKIRKAIGFCGLGFTMLQLPVMFVSHWSWHPGTKPFSFVLNRSLPDRKAEYEARLKRAGAWELEEYLRKHPHAGLCVGYSNGEESALHQLSCLHEDFEQNGGHFWRVFDSKTAFRQYLNWARPDLFIMPKSLSYSPCGPGTPIRLVFDELAQNKDVIKIESRNFWALDLSGFPRGFDYVEDQ